jgi:hypothetical protein
MSPAAPTSRPQPPPPTAADPPGLLRRRRRRQLWITVPAVGLFFVLAIGRFLLVGALDWRLVVGLLALVGVLLLASHRLWRCPVCERYLGEELWPASCPHCGVPFDRR